MPFVSLGSIFTCSLGFDKRDPRCGKFPLWSRTNLISVPDDDQMKSRAVLVTKDSSRAAVE